MAQAISRDAAGVRTEFTNSNPGSPGPAPQVRWRLSKRLTFAGPLIASAALFGCSGSPPSAETGQVASEIVGGEVDTTHESVFGVVIHLGQGGGATCTGTLIAPNLLLTARHCISPTPAQEVVCGESAFGTPYGAQNIYASNAVNMRQSTRWFQGASIHVPTEGNDTCGFDVALVVLAENVPASVAVPSVPRIDRGVEAGEGYVAVGYGLDESGEAGERMVRDDLTVACTPGTCGFGIRVSEFRGEEGICEGDSGGPAFDANGKVVGVVSRGAVPCASPVYGTVTAWKTLIMDVALQAAERGGYPAPFWAKSGESDVPLPPDAGKAELGEPCRGSASCASGLACFRPTDSEAPSCVARCESTADCESGLQCRSVDGASLCLPPSTVRHDSGCSLAAAPSSDRRALGASGFAVALLLYGARRRRATRRRRDGIASVD